MIEIFPFPVVKRFVACLTLISGCAFMCLFVKAQPEVCVVCGFLFLFLMAQNQQHNRSWDGLA